MDTVWASRLCSYIYCNVVVVLIVSVSCTSRSHPWTPVSTGLNQRVRFASDLCSETVRLVEARWRSQDKRHRETRGQMAARAGGGAQLTI